MSSEQSVPVWVGRFAHLNEPVHAVASKSGDVLFMAQGDDEADECPECGSTDERALGIRRDCIGSLIQWLETVKRELIDSKGDATP